MFETASFHIIKNCNMRCKFCYATFTDFQSKMLSLEDSKIILLKLKIAGLQKITFAGGEPLMYKYINEIISYAKEIGLTTSIITNGSLLSKEFINNHILDLDWIGLSIDSISFTTNNNIGRLGMDGHYYYALIDLIKSNNFKLKINTVVNVFNQEESLQELIDFADPNRWKIFDTLRVEGQNDTQFDKIKSTKFNDFVNRHNHRAMVIENNEKMTGSYLLIDPLGRLFENSKGIHTYSSKLQYSTIEKCISEISLDRNMFLQRGGIYEW